MSKFWNIPLEEFLKESSQEFQQKSLQGFQYEKIQNKIWDSGRIIEEICRRILKEIFRIIPIRIRRNVRHKSPEILWKMQPESLRIEH